MKRKHILLLSSGIFIVGSGISFCLAAQSKPVGDAFTQAQISQARVNALDAHVTSRMRADFINRLMRGISGGDLAALQDCVCWDGVEQPVREQVLASLQDVLDGAKDFPVEISFVRRVDAGQMTRVVAGQPQIQNLPWITNIGFRLDGRLAPASAGRTLPVGVKDGRLYVICLARTPSA